MFFWNSLAFLMIQRMLAIWSLVPLPFLNLAWKFWFMYCVKPCLENSEHYFASVWDECNCMVVWTLFGIPFFGIGMKCDLFQSCGHCWVFQLCWHIECSTLTASSFKIWNSTTGIDLPGGSAGKESTWQSRRRKRHGLNPLVGKISWRRKWHPPSSILA